MANKKTYEIAFQLGAKIDSSLRTAFANANKSIGNLNKQVGTVNRSAGRLSGAFGRMQTTFSTTANKISSNISRGIISPFRTATDVVRGFGTTLAASVGLLGSGALIQSGINRLSAIENAEVSLRVMMGSAEKAKAFLDDMLAFARTTPFAFPDLAEISRNLIAFGMDEAKVIPTMKAIGDAAAASGKGAEGLRQIASAFGAIQVSGTLSLGEVNRLMDAGIPALKILANQTGKSVDQIKKDISSGMFESSKAIEMLVDGMQNGTDGIAGSTAAMAGIMEEMKDTWVGSIDSLKASISSTMATLLEPVKPHIQAGMKWFGDTFSKLPVLFEKIGPSFQKAFSPLGKALIEIGGELKNTLPGLFAAVLQVVQKTFSFISKVIVNVLKPIFFDAVNFLIDIWGQIKTFFQKDGAQIIRAVQNVFGFISKVMQVLAPVILFILKSVWANIKGVIQGALNIIMGFLKVFASLFTGDWKGLWEGVKKLFGGAIQFLWNIWNLLMLGKLVGSIKALATHFWGFLRNLGSKITTNVQYYYHLFVDGFYRIAGGILQAIGKGVGNVLGVIRNAGSTFIQVFSIARTFGVNIFLSIVSAIRNVFTMLFGTIRTAISNTISTVTGAIQGFFATVRSILSNLWSVVVTIFGQIRSAMAHPFQSLGTVVSSVVSYITGLIRGLFNNMVSLGRSAINGLIMAANAVIGGLNRLKVNIPDWVPQFGGRTFGLNIPAIPMLAKGGIVTSATLAMIGEGSEPEAVLPISKLKDFLGTSGGSTTNIQNHNQPQIIYSPQIYIQGNADQATIERVTQRDYNEFKRWLDRYFAERERLSFRG